MDARSRSNTIDRIVRMSEADAISPSALFAPSLVTTKRFKVRHSRRPGRLPAACNAIQHQALEPQTERLQAVSNETVMLLGDALESNGSSMACSGTSSLDAQVPKCLPDAQVVHVDDVFMIGTEPRLFTWLGT